MNRVSEGSLLLFLFLFPNEKNSNSASRIVLPGWAQEAANENNKMRLNIH